MPVCVMEGLAMGVLAILSNRRGCWELSQLMRRNCVVKQLSSDLIYEKIPVMLQGQKVFDEYTAKLRQEISRECYPRYLLAMYEKLCG